MEVEQTQVTKLVETDSSESLEESGSNQSSKVDSEIQYDDELGDEVPFGKGVFVPLTPRTLNLIDFGDLSNFENIIGEDEVGMMLRRYPFCHDYNIRTPDSNDRVHLSPKGMVAIYID